MDRGQNRGQSIARCRGIGPTCRSDFLSRAPALQGPAVWGVGPSLSPNMTHEQIGDLLLTPSTQVLLCVTQPWTSKVSVIIRIICLLPEYLSTCIRPSPPTILPLPTRWMCLRCWSPGTVGLLPNTDSPRIHESSEGYTIPEYTTTTSTTTMMTTTTTTSTTTTPLLLLLLYNKYVLLLDKTTSDLLDYYF